MKKITTDSSQTDSKITKDSRGINSFAVLCSACSIAAQNEKNTQPLDYKAYEVFIRKYKNFIFNIEVLNLINKFTKTYTEIVQIEKFVNQKILDSPKGKNISVDSSPPIRSSVERESTEDESNLNETFEMLKAKKSSIESELCKLELYEKRRYEANPQLEQQNFEVKL